MSRPRLAFGACLLDVDPGCEALRIELARLRREEEIDALALGKPRILFLGPWVSGEVLVQVELRRVDEQGQNDDLAVGPRCTKQGQMSVMQRAHRRDEPNPLGGIDRFANLADRAQRLHRAVASL